ncbi:MULTISPECIES: hypothetical protein [Agarivorans]|uniref:Uncharacterized protein n=1 Tax=Agarivorans albus MKT 106 TaxID=1331007 RepID=R9PFC5_AGAAL|nr:MULTISPECIES: hypothetical protein [Agarivorans]UQN43129.1 hypothetical protein LQZ07_01235 [Agarivorans sp. B2Z047]GAD00084.1 hypothetical protein AALB_0164 [Agarivorans albus MKT 106]
MGYLLLALMLVLVLPAVSFFLGYIHLYLEYGVVVSATIIALWLFFDFVKIKKR